MTMHDIRDTALLLLAFCAIWAACEIGPVVMGWPR